MSKLQTLIIFISTAFCIFSKANEELELCQTYEFHGQLSSNLKETPQISTHDGFGVSIDLLVKAKGDVILDLLALKGKPVVAKAWLEKKVTARKYEAKVYQVVLNRPSGVGMKTGIMKAKKIDDKLPESCSQ